MTLSAYNGHSGKKRDRVQRWLNAQWAAGTLPRPKRCEACGQTEGAIQAHLENYDHPEQYTELCVTCHLMLHSRHRQPGQWALYKSLVRQGYQHRPLSQREAFGVLQSTWLNRMFYPELPDDFDPADPIVTYLDTIPQRQTAPGVNGGPYDRGAGLHLPLA